MTWQFYLFSKTKSTWEWKQILFQIYLIIIYPHTSPVPFFISKLQNTFNSILYSIVHFPRIWLSSEHMEKRSILANNNTYVYNLPSLSV